MGRRTALKLTHRSEVWRWGWKVASLAGFLLNGTQVRGKHPYVRSTMISLELDGHKIKAAEIHKSRESALIIREFRINIVLSFKAGSKHTYKTRKPIQCRVPVSSNRYRWILFILRK